MRPCFRLGLDWIMKDDVASPDGSPVAVVGAGAVGTVLARRLVTAGYPVQAVLSRTVASAQALADQVGAPVGTDDVTALPADVRLVVLCVPDGAIADVAETLASLDHRWERTTVLHTSGRHPAAVLDPLAEHGAAPLSFHPLQTFTPDTPPEAFEDIVIGVEGPPDAVAVGKVLARSLGATPLVLSADDKVRYHSAAALASNGLVALMGVVEELLSAADLDDGAFAEDDAPTGAAAIMAPLIEQTWVNLKRQSPESVLTGPVARGDRETVAAHLNALAEDAPHLLPLYAALSTEMVRIAVRGGQLRPDTAETLLSLFQGHLAGPDDDSDSRNPSR
jgi:predicted short-subunit dehydrogenase-like oxidoreductase (DUF2520 family)